ATIRLPSRRRLNWTRTGPRGAGPVLGSCLPGFWGGAVDLSHALRSVPATETRMPYYLGLDSSTQSLSAMAIDPEQGRVVLDESVNFGRDLPHYASPHGFLANENPNIKHSNPLMWVEALDLLLSRVRASGFDLSAVRAVSGAGQQHGSVYLSTPLSEAGKFPTDRGLADSVRPLLSRASAPI